MTERTTAVQLVQALLLRDQAALQPLPKADVEEVEELVTIVLSILLPMHFGESTTYALIEDFVNEVAQTYPQDKTLPKNQAMELVVYLLSGKETMEDWDPDRSSVTELQMMSIAAAHLKLEGDEAKVEDILHRAKSAMNTSETENSASDPD